VFERCDDSSGTVSGIFHTACSDLGDIAQAGEIDPRDLADHAFQALIKNDYGQFDSLIEVLTPALGQEGLEHLKQRMIALSGEPVRRPTDKERQIIGWGSSGRIYADDLAERSRINTVRLALKEIADAQGDVDAFIAQYDEQTRKVPKIAADIARRLRYFAMPAWGRSRLFGDVRRMSGLPPTSDVSRPGRHFAFVPLPEVASVTRSPRRRARAQGSRFGTPSTVRAAHGAGIESAFSAADRRD
jgi:hypothetical protein